MNLELLRSFLAETLGSEVQVRDEGTHPTQDEEYWDTEIVVGECVSVWRDTIENTVVTVEGSRVEKKPGFVVGSLAYIQEHPLAPVEVSVEDTEEHLDFGSALADIARRLLEDRIVGFLAKYEQEELISAWEEDEQDRLMWTAERSGRMQDEFDQAVFAGIIKEG